MTQFREFVLNNFKTLTAVVAFIVTMYVQHMNNISRIAELTDKCTSLEMKINDQYEKIECARIG